jgi:hypothetical protein
MAVLRSWRDGPVRTKQALKIKINRMSYEELEAFLVEAKDLHYFSENALDNYVKRKLDKRLKAAGYWMTTVMGDYKIYSIEKPTTGPYPIQFRAETIPEIEHWLEQKEE